MNNIGFTEDVANELLDKRLIRKQTHPTLDLTIWNYTQFAQFSNAWDEYPVLLHLRGLVTDSNFNIVGRPFKKFFNIEENRHITGHTFEVFEKMDGSLGLAFWYQDQWIMATRGSFVSDQAIKGMEMLNRYDLTNLNKKCTYLFEIIYWQNRIVLEYDFEDIVALAVIYNESGFEFEHLAIAILDSFGPSINNCPRIVKRYDGFKDFSTLKDLIGDDQEGYVVKFDNGNRCKIKGDEYCRLHRIITNVTSYSIWDALLEGTDISEIVDNLPDEIFVKVKEFIDDMNLRVETIFADCVNIASKLTIKYMGEAPHYQRKFIALDIKENYNDNAKIIFAMLNDKFSLKKVKTMIYQRLKPEYFKF